MYLQFEQSNAIEHSKMNMQQQKNEKKNRNKKQTKQKQKKITEEIHATARNGTAQLHQGIYFWLCLMPTCAREPDPRRPPIAIQANIPARRSAG